MVNKITKPHIASSLSGLGWYQLTGGAVGVVLVIYGIISYGLTNPLSIVLYLFMLLFFGYSVLCGLFCIQHRRNALQHSLINQCLQLVSFALGAYSFSYVAGVFVSAGVDFTNSFNMGFSMGISKLFFNINSGPERMLLNINFVALALIIWIIRLKRNLRAADDAAAAGIGEEAVL